MFSNGVLKAGGEREILSRPKKWPLGPLLAPGAQFIPGTSIDMEPIEMEAGDLTGVKVLTRNARMLLLRPDSRSQ